MNPFKRIRIRLGLTQAEIASEVGKGQSNISHYETGRLNVPTDVAKALVALGKKKGKRVTLADLYGSSPREDK
ncbi:helix-turn-helix domain-containing protein [Orrella dioscoreae]|uniref:HTH cro/C1-type domain-containing protein n=1 Tax=Orrella dioscoreae TaxID=1851544 RepID=A0A1C3K379_9BURK|nr:helix-turn-helix transcriptional regulator [Orrella dioscoreae]SBT25961.1 hypothetical protein ODI_01769 [Orrella dioscoreae]SOE50888.1 hypothetical protein ODI_R3042 [Orrella dioscoreae]